MKLIATRRQRDPPSRNGDGGSLHLKRSYPALGSSVGEARAAITAYAQEMGARGEQLEAIRLAASEALSNAVRFAYPARDGHVHVNAWVAAGELWVLITDNGCGMHAGAESDGLGLGLALISKVCDGFSIVERSSGGTEVRLRFDLSSAVEASAPPRKFGDIRGDPGGAAHRPRRLT
jgi:anti-sigma regulatory factor (Ser/Thr protein kinase)